MLCTSTTLVVVNALHSVAKYCGSEHDKRPSMVGITLHGCGYDDTWSAAD